MNGGLSLRESPQPLELRNGENRDVDLSAVDRTPYSQYLIKSPTAAFSIDGIQSLENADGQLVRLINISDQTMTIVHNSSGSKFKIVCPSDTNLVLSGSNSSVTLQYSKGLSKWTVVGYASKQAKNIYYATTPGVANTEISKGDSSWEDMAGMSITFTPVNSIVFVTYNVSGDVKASLPTDRVEGQFQLLMNSNVVKNTTVITAPLSNNATYQAVLPMFPLSVTPGVPVTLKVQWSRHKKGVLYNNPWYESHGRYMTIID